ncbi:MAG TPA: DNA repair protein RecO [Chthonomonadales bacterium]|nr:DNA repair protein RecO [Chthonomonadales bacterium]
MPVYKATAIVLHRIHLGETDKIVTLLTREVGKLNAVAKGARRLTSKLSGATELFTYSRLLLAAGKSLDIISQCEIQESFPTLRSDLSLLARASYLCELTDRLVQEREPNPEVFDLLLSALYLLQRVRSNPDVILHAFELHLLAERGYAPELERCVHCGRELEPQGTRFSPLLGGMLCVQCRYAEKDSVPLSPKTRDWMRQILRLEPEEIVDVEISSDTEQELTRCLRWYIRHRAERDLKSAEFLEVLRVAGTV